MAKEELFPGVFYLQDVKLATPCTHTNDKGYNRHAVGMYDSGGGKEVCLECLLGRLWYVGALQIKGAGLRILND